MVRVSSPAKLRPWSELTAKMVMGIVPGLVISPTEMRISIRQQNWAEPKRGGQNIPKSKASRGWPSETAFQDPPKAVSEEVGSGEFWEFLRDLLREMEWGGDKTYRGEEGRKLFSVGGLLVRFCPPPLFLHPPLAFSVQISGKSSGSTNENPRRICSAKSSVATARAPGPECQPEIFLIYFDVFRCGHIPHNARLKLQT